MSDRLLTQVERQRKALGRLPKDYTFPLFNSRQALESQRRNGYRNTAAAAREIVDNALEAGATKIHVIFERPKALEKFQRQDSVAAVAFIDNGCGMLPEMARYALSWGGGSHFDDPDFIGKFGFGLPNASINQTRVVEVYTRTSKEQRFTKARLDVRHVAEHGIQTIDPPVEADLPDFVKRYVTKEGFDPGHGTVVVWVEPDRLTYSMAARLKEHLVDDFGVTYRYLLRTETGKPSVDLKVENLLVEPVDPLFLDPRGRHHRPPEQDGAQPVYDEAIPVKYIRGPEGGMPELQRLEPGEEMRQDDSDLLAVGAIHVKIARFPLGFAVGRETEGIKPIDEQAKARWEIRKSRRGMSFVRAGREIETVDAFPRSARDIGSGLGDWPLLQSYAYHWGVEVKFEPSLDEVFGITNDKQTVRPVEEFWRLLVREDIDTLLHRENQWQAAQRDRRKPKAEPSATPTPAEVAATQVDVVTGQRTTVPEERKPEARANLEEAAQRRAGVSKQSIEEARAALEQEAQRRRYRIDYVDVERGPVYEPEWEGELIIIKINRRHAFYEALYGELLRLPGGTRAKEAVDVLLIGLGRAELMTTDQQAQLWYQTQREDVWSPFLAKAMAILAQTLRPSEEEVTAGQAA